jgi:hypothetical protein
MRLRVPDSGSFADALLHSLGDPTTLASGDWIADAVTAEQLDEAIAALSRGDIEFFILEDGDDFLQVAGDGEGPFQVELSEDAEMRTLAGGARMPAMREIVHAYRRGDTAWRAAPWTPLTT